MSINQFSSELQQQSLWWHRQHQLPIMEPNPTDPSFQRHRFSSSQNPYPNHQDQHHNWPPHYFYLNSYASQESPPPLQTMNHPTLDFNLNHPNDAEPPQEENSPRHHQEQQQQQTDESDKEPMFEKPLTPSDVGKLNRLVIPKQYAEKYFPLGGAESAAGEKGLLLSFEDEAGKLWRFRYSYWNSSQSYVLTKGWSRYVKEKRLDAGDVILFERHRSEMERLFIGWRRRGGSTAGQEGGNGGSSGGWNRGLMNSGQLSYPKDVTAGTGVTTVPYQPDCLHAGSVVAAQSQTGNNNSKTLRLFGVNMECQMDESEPSTPDGSSSSASSYCQATAASANPNYHPHPHYMYHPQAYSSSSSSNRHNHMDITFSQDVNQLMRNHHR